MPASEIQEKRKKKNQKEKEENKEEKIEEERIEEIAFFERKEDEGGCP